MAQLVMVTPQTQSLKTPYTHHIHILFCSTKPLWGGSDSSTAEHMTLLLPDGGPGSKASSLGEREAECTQ